MTANRGRKWHQSIDNFKLYGRPFSLFILRGTPSWGEHKTIYTTTESASTGWIGKIRSSVSAYSRSTVPHVHRTATVCQAPLPYIILSWLVPIDGPMSSLYSHCRYGTGPYCTVAVRWQLETVWRFDRFLMKNFAPVPDFKIVCTLTQTILLDLFDQSRLIQELWRRWRPFYTPLVMISL